MTMQESYENSQKVAKTRHGKICINTRSKSVKNNFFSREQSNKNAIHCLM